MARIEQPLIHLLTCADSSEDFPALPLDSSRILACHRNNYAPQPLERSPTPAGLRIIDHLQPAFAHFKIGSHRLDLGSLLLELGGETLCLLSEFDCKSLYLLLLLRDRCLQLLNFANFPIYCGATS